MRKRGRSRRRRWRALPESLAERKSQRRRRRCCCVCSAAGVCPTAAGFAGRSGSGGAAWRCAGDERVEGVPTALPEAVRSDAIELDPGVVERLVQPVDLVAGLLGYWVDARAKAGRCEISAGSVCAGLDLADCGRSFSFTGCAVAAAGNEWLRSCLTARAAAIERVGAHP